MTFCSEIKIISEANKILRTKITEEINTKQISVSEMSRRLGIKQPNLHRFLKGYSGLNSNSIEKIANYFTN